MARSVADDLHLQVGGQLSIRAWTHLSIAHIASAALFARQSYLLEHGSTGTASQSLLEDHRSYVLGGVTSAAAFLEAAVNELFAGAADKDFKGQIQSQVRTQLVDTLGTLWKSENFDQGLGVLLKIQVALIAAGKPALDRGKQPYQDAKLLISLRNDLLHYKPTWTPGVGSDDKPHGLEAKLRNKFALNQLLPANPVFLISY